MAVRSDVGRDGPDTVRRTPAGVVLVAESTALPGGSGTIEQLAQAVDATVAAGVRTVIVRDKHRPPDERAAVVAAAKSAGATVLLATDGPGDPLGAHGLHLSARHERCRTPSLTRPAVLGMSCHDVAEIERAATIGADYVTVSPVYPTASKPGYGPALGPDGLAALVEACPVPVVALGGITTADAVVECRGAGAVAVAVMGAVLRAEDPASVAAALVAPFLEDPTATRSGTDLNHPDRRGGAR